MNSTKQRKKVYWHFAHAIKENRIRKRVGYARTPLLPVAEKKTGMPWQ